MSDREEYGKYLEHELRLVQSCIITHSMLLSDLQDLIEPLEKLIRRARKVAGSYFAEEKAERLSAEIEDELNRDFQRDLAFDYT